MVTKIAKYFNFTLPLLLSMTIAGSCNAATNPSTINTSYQSSSEDFPNPERGFYINFRADNENSPLPLQSLQNARAKNITLVKRIYHIPQFRNSALSQNFLNLIAQDCKVARQAGVKLIIVFTYNFEDGGSDASRSTILSHLDQLQPTLKANQDVVALMDAGFIGYWGEWHHSKNGLDNTTDRKAILSKILSVLPKNRMVGLRYAEHKTQIFNNTNPLTPEEAFNGSERARTGAVNNCFLAGYEDWGTYDWQNPEKTKNFLSLDNRYVAQGGETCNPSEYDDCPNALNDLERMHWSYINSEFEETVLKGWQDQGCMATIKRRLGYRFRLINSTIPKKVKPAGTFSMQFQITNEGWASPYNPRNLEVILRNKTTGQKYYLPLSEAVRMWMPGETKAVNVTGGIPANMPSGEYEVLLNLPDPLSSLNQRPEYSIRLANQNVWQASTGYNSLLQSVIVDSNATGGNYSGSQFFKLR